MKLKILHAATSLETLRVPPSNHLESLRGDREGQHSIRINQQWRICFTWQGNHACDVEIVDYHWNEGIMTKRDFPPIHPGTILLAEFLEPLGISQYRLAKDIGVTPRRINEIIHGRRAISADTALRLGRFFNMEAEFWLNLQSHYDMEVALESLADRLDKEVHPFTHAA